MLCGIRRSCTRAAEGLSRDRLGAGAMHDAEGDHGQELVAARGLASSAMTFSSAVIEITPSVTAAPTTDDAAFAAASIADQAGLLRLAKQAVIRLRRTVGAPPQGAAPPPAGAPPAAGGAPPP